MRLARLPCGYLPPYSGQFNGAIVGSLSTLGKDAWSVAVSLAILFAGVLFVTIVFVYATVPDPAGVTPFDHFPTHGFNRDLVLIVTALTGFAVYDLLGVLRTCARTAGWAITLVFFTFVVSVITAAVVGPELKAHANIIAGIFFGISLAALLDVAQATAAGVAWKLRPPEAHPKVVSSPPASPSLPSPPER